MRSLAFLLATIFSICSDLSQDGRTLISNKSTHLRGAINQINKALSSHNTCASDECAIPSSEAMDQIDTRAPHIADNNMNPNALLMRTFKRKRKKTNQCMMAMQRKVGETCHVDRGLIQLKLSLDSKWKEIKSAGITDKNMVPKFHYYRHH
eukprot:537397_1